MNALEQCEEATVELRTLNGTTKISGHRWQDFAVVKETSVGYQIAHLPSGMCFGAAEDNTIWIFSTVEQAAQAMIEISRLRNRWVELPEDNDDGQQIDVICRKHGGTVSRGKDGPDALKREKSLNGYEEPTIERKET